MRRFKLRLKLFWTGELRMWEWRQLKRLEGTDCPVCGLDCNCPKGFGTN